MNMDPGPHTCRRCNAPLFEIPEPIRTSPVPDVLGTNSVPPPSKVPAIRDLISKLAENLPRVETELARMQAVVDRLVLERDELKDMMEGHRDLLTPARALPPELLSQIFIHCLEEEEPSIDRAPLLLGRVCRRWRSISLSTPELWSSIATQVYRDRIPRIHDWIARAGNLPTSMSLREPDWVYRGAEKVLLEAIAPPPPRLRELSVRSACCGDEVSASQQLFFPDLQKLALHFTRRRTGDSVLTVFQNSPQLYEVNLELLVPLSRVALPWHQLTRLQVYLSFLEEFVHVLHLSPNLQEYSALDMPSDPNLHPSLAPHMQSSEDSVTHSHLTSFRIVAMRSSLADYLFRHTTMPSLRSATVELRSYSSESEFDCLALVDAFVGFLHRSRCNIKELCLRNVTIDEDELIRCLVEMPCLLRLELRGSTSEGYPGSPHIGGKVLSLLSSNEPTRTPSLLPQLSTIVLDLYGEAHQLFPSRVHAMIRSRWTATAQDPGLAAPPGRTSLAHVKLTFSNCFNILFVEDELRPFEDLREEGLDVGVFLERGYGQPPHEYLGWEPKEGRYRFFPSQ